MTQEYSSSKADRVWPGTYHTIPPFFISEWSQSPLALNYCSPWPLTVACLDPRSMPTLTLTALPVLGQSWPSIMVCYGSWSVDLLWASTQKFQAGIVQYNQFAVNTGTSDTNCRSSCCWGSSPWWFLCVRKVGAWERHPVSLTTTGNWCLWWKPSSVCLSSAMNLVLAGIPLTNALGENMPSHY